MQNHQSSKKPGKGGKFKIYPRENITDRGWFTQIPNEVINGIGIYGAMHASEYRLYTKLLSLRTNHTYRTMSEMLRMVGADWNTAREQLPRLVQLGLVKVHEDGWEVVFSDDLTQENIPDRPLSRKKRTKAQNDVNPKVKKDLEISNETQGLTGRISSLSERAPEIIEEHRQSPRTQSSNEAEEEDLF